MSNLLHRGIGATLITGVLTAGVIGACSRDAAGLRTQGPAPQPSRKSLLVDPADQEGMRRMLDQIADRRVILVGETHDRYDHHQNQLAVIRSLRERGVAFAIGMELFQTPFQPHLDAFVAGQINEKQLLKKTQYYNRWRYDYRLYRDILEYARTQGIPLVALNAPSELVSRVSQGGLAALTPEESAGLVISVPAGETAYESRLRPIFELHGSMDEARFQRFADVQRLWDAYMARTASELLSRHPDKRLVILAGSGHVLFRDAIPGRISDLEARDVALLGTGPRDRYPGSDPDFLFVERDLALEPAGQMGMELAGQDDGVRVQRVRPRSPAEEAGFQTGDTILSIAGEPVRSIEDVRLALLDRAPGDALWVDWLRRDNRGGEDRSRRLSAPLTLL